MDHYVVTGVSEREERNVSCTTTSGEHECPLAQLDGTANDYKFTAFGVTQVNDTSNYRGATANDCGEVALIL